MENEKIALELLEYLKSADCFVKEQAPLIAQEILRFGWIDSLFGLGIAICVALCVIVFLYFFDYSKFDVPCIGFGCFILFVCFMLSFGMILNLIKISTAPRVYIIEKIKKM